MESTKSGKQPQIPTQNFTPRLTKEEILAALDELEPKRPWVNFYDFGHGIYSVSPDNEKPFSKGVGLKKIGRMIVDLVPYITKKGTTKGLRVLDLASAEGIHSLELAREGAETLGIEGRQLYVDRARFAARAFGLSNAIFEKGDVRRVSKAHTGSFDLVLFLGILHHLGKEDFLPMLKTLREVTGDTLVIYTHVSCPESVEKWNLEGPVTIESKYTGSLYREHPDDADEKTRERRVRSSLDNTFSFWATEVSLAEALKESGFTSVAKLVHPNPFKNVTQEFRQFWICRP